MVLIAFFTVIFLWNIYEWLNGRTGLDRNLSPLIFILIGLASIFGEKNKTLRIVLTAIAAILAIVMLTLMFIR